jgi:hypothetical protein
MHAHYIELNTGAKGILVISYELHNEVKFLDMAQKERGFQTIAYNNLRFRGYCSADLGTGFLTFVRGTSNADHNPLKQRWYI